jgi:hypothetical protein
MTGPLACRRRWKSPMRLILRASLLAGMAIVSVARSYATGYPEPRLYLDQGGENVTGSPEFYWDLEVKRLARDFKPAEKLVLPRTNTQNSSDQPERNFKSELTSTADINDFDAAVAEGRIKPPDPAKAKQEHEVARKFIAQTNDKTTGKLPEEFDSEFSDYHRGAFAYRLGKEHWEEARKAWEALLQRPAEQRHYRTVWATFMLGKLAMKSGSPDAVKWFRQTRDLAKEGFADSLGMAADSYGWEGRSEWKQNHPEKAAPLFLTQLALGDESAIVSLKALIPDREPVPEQLNYGPEWDERRAWNEQQKRDAEQKALAGLRAAAKDLLLRRLVTAHILATESVIPLFGEEETSDAHVNRCARWLSIIKETKLGSVEGAEYLGWLSYINGDYKGAAHWLDLAKGDSAVACWLRAKLQLRAGKLQEAQKSMTQAWHSIRPISSYTGWKGVPEEFQVQDFSYTSGRDEPSWSFEEAASGDLAGLRLVRADFVAAMDALLKGGLWNDAAFVAERVLTANELKRYVDQQPATATPAPNDWEGDSAASLRYLLGRRLVREHRFKEAAHYLKPPYDKVLEKYTKALADGENRKLSKLERAHAWFAAAWLARHDGMELMGTETAPDVFSTEGEFEITDLAQQRESGKYRVVQYENDGQEKTITRPLALKPSRQELRRLAKNEIKPDVRYHYRVIAGALAIRAVQFLPDNSEELADVVNTAGLWVKDRVEKIGDRYYQILEKRCPKTVIGGAAIAKHWFVDQTGPWSQQQEQELTALHKELGLPSDQ